MARTVLIVDDHAGFRALARRMLTADGWDVVGEAEDGAGALTAARDLSPEIVVLDLNLPDASGLDIAERLTRDPPSPAVVLTSSHDDAELGSLARERRASGFIPKQQFSGDALSAAVEAG